MKGKLIQIFGSPSSGKSTLASELYTEMKKKGFNSVLVNEYSTDYIAEYGIPNSPIDQMVIFYNQLNRETMFLDNKDFVICDSSSILNYFYFRKLFSNKLENKDIATINHLQKEILKHINTIDKIYYVPTIDSENTDDGIRYQSKEEIIKIGNWIKSYLELENISHIDLSKIDIKERAKYIIKDLKG
jgi:nicotinamide riboside kinase